ncbi:prsS1 (nucleomorph) [Hemiselmis andersenii]|uniref:PrsS1 n=4 Tax=Hemiselmis andersenii TaxID=464988 RepID=A9BL63_HEMAN|nr:prsS1 [Hemiselmis andersenii]ABW98246.1 prsS1 [Hemiselmis andersenii]
MKYFSNYYEKITFLQNCRFFDKLSLLICVNELKNSLWIEILLEISYLFEKKRPNTIVTNLKFKFFSLFLDSNLKKFSKEGFTKPKKIPNIIDNLKISHTLSIDEYIKARLNGLKFFRFYSHWKRNTWKLIELVFENIMKTLFSSGKIKEFFFLLNETNRYDLLTQIIQRSKKKINFFCFFIRSGKYFKTTRHKLWIDFLANQIINRKIPKKTKLLKNEFTIPFFLIFLKTLILKKKKGIKKFLMKIKNSINFIIINQLRTLFDNFSENGVFNTDFYWCKSFLKYFFFLLYTIFTGKLEENLFLIRPVLKKLETQGLIKIKNFLKSFYQERDLSDFLLKTSTIYALGIISNNINQNFFFIEFLSKFDKISGWLKFFIGNSLFMINYRNWKFFKPFLNFFENNLISPHIKGGVFFGVGIEFKNSFSFEKIFIKKFHFILSNPKDSILKYGATLGLSLCVMKKIRDPKKSYSFNLIKNAISSDLISGVAFGLSIGLIFLGSFSFFLLKKISTLLHETEHEKIEKTLVLSIALLFYKKKEQSSIIFNKFFREKDPILRYSSILIQTLAYAETGNFQIVRKFLKIIANDSNNEIKKASLIGIGFIFYSKFEIIKKIFKQLTGNYNPFIRYGVCFGIALSIGRKKHKEGIEVLKKLTEDPVDFVRSAAFISLGMIFFQQKDSYEKNKIKKFLKQNLKNKDNSNFSRFGIIIGFSFVEFIGGRRKIQNKNINFKEEKIIGAFLFIQHWSWLPLLPFILI